MENELHTVYVRALRGSLNDFEVAEAIDVSTAARTDIDIADGDRSKRVDVVGDENEVRPPRWGSASSASRER